MKIHKIRIKNIASLKGQHEVDFDNSLLEQGSFAITGDTGAGKSTILNCVALALYGRSYKGLNQGDFVTLGESSGKVELTFSCGGNFYLSIWGCRVRKKNGEFLKTPSHTKEFFRLRADQKEILDASPEDIVHLSFDQFCKTVILNQGEFAKFLTSSFRERKDILEKLYQGDKLDVFNPLLRDRISKLATKADQADARIKGLGEHIQEDITQKGLEALEKDSQKKAGELQVMRKRSESLKELSENDKALKITNQRIEEISKKIDSHVIELNAFLKTKAQFDQEREKVLQKHKERSPGLHHALEWEKSLQKNQDQAKLIALALKKSQTDLDKAQIDLKEHDKKLKELNLKKKELEASKSHQELSSEELAKAELVFEELVAANNKLDHLKEFGAHLADSMKTSETKQATLKKELESTNDKLSTLNVLELEKAQKDMEAKERLLQGLSIGLAHLKEEDIKNKRELAELEKKLLSNRKELAKAQEKSDQEKELIQNQRELIKSAQEAHAKLICLQESLDKNKCVLCDSDDIGHVKRQFDTMKDKDFTKASGSLERLEKEHENTFQTLQRERSAHSALLAQIEQLKEKQTSAHANLLSHHQDALTVIDQNSPKLDMADLQSALEEKQDFILKTKSELRKALQEEQELAHQKRHIQKALTELEAQLNELRPKHSRAQKEFREESSKAKAKQNELEKALNSDSLEGARAVLKTAKEIHALKHQIGMEEKQGELVTERLSRAKKDQKDSQSEYDGLEKETSLLKQKIKDTCGDQSPEEALKELEKEAHVIEHKRKTMDRDLKDLEIEKSALFSRRQTFEEQRKDQENMGIKLWGEKREELNGEGLISDELKGLLKELSQSELPPSGEELSLALELSEKDLAVAKEAMEETKAELSEYRAVLKRQESAKEQIKGLSDELKKLNEKKAGWEELYLLIGKDEFRNYVLAMVEKLLIQQTNAELSKLCDGRYLIQHKTSSSKLAPDFYIIDKFRGDDTRKVSTLSGGETFMVSLAMALALAELTRGNADIDSFFIDEGFGTLDKDSLEEALEMLQDIETRGKQIGLISHVKELTNRIPVNIHLQKNRLGNSSIDIVYN